MFTNYERSTHTILYLMDHQRLTSATFHNHSACVRFQLLLVILCVRVLVSRARSPVNNRAGLAANVASRIAVRG